MNLFDNLQDTMFSTVANTMGYSASWTPAGGQPYSAQVLYKGPTEKEKLLSATYDPDKLVMEYKAGAFPGLEEAAGSNMELEVVEIIGVGSFYVKSVGRKFDGKTFEAALELKP